MTEGSVGGGDREPFFSHLRFKVLLHMDGVFFQAIGEKVVRDYVISETGRKDFHLCVFHRKRQQPPSLFLYMMVYDF